MWIARWNNFVNKRIWNGKIRGQEKRRMVVGQEEKKRRWKTWLRRNVNKVVEKGEERTWMFAGETCLVFLSFWLSLNKWMSWPAKKTWGNGMNEWRRRLLRLAFAVDPVGSRHHLAQERTWKSEQDVHSTLEKVLTRSSPVTHSSAKDVRRGIA